VTTRPASTQTLSPDYPAILGNIGSFRSAFHVLEDSRLVSEKLGELVQRFSVKGRQVHDANIAATMLKHGLQNLFTHNRSDFVRFSPLITVHPLQS